MWGKKTYSEKNLSQFHFVGQKPHMECPEIEFGASVVLNRTVNSTVFVFRFFT